MSLVRNVCSPFRGDKGINVFDGSKLCKFTCDDNAYCTYVSTNFNIFKETNPLDLKEMHYARIKFYNVPW